MSVVEVRQTLSGAVRGILADPSIGEDLRDLGVRAVQALYAIEAVSIDEREPLLQRACEYLHALGHAAPRHRTSPFLALRRRLMQVIFTRGKNGDAVQPHLDVTVNHQSHSNFFTGVSGDIIDGGVFVATEETLPVGTEVSLKVSLPAGKLISRGRVSFVRPEGPSPNTETRGMGIRLSSPGLLQQEPVMRLLASREPLFEP